MNGIEEDCLEQWETAFRKDAEKDGLRIFRDHLARLGLPDEPELLLHGTVLAMAACCAYAGLDGRPQDEFIQLQKYFPEDAPDAEYAFTFDICGKAYARILTPVNRGILDLADLYGHPWWEYEVVGYRRFWVSRTDECDLSPEEIARIETEITDDLRFDYCENELDFFFDDSIVDGVLQVDLLDGDDFLDDEGTDEEDSQPMGAG